VTSPAADARAQHLYERITKALEWPMAVLALAVIPALLLDQGATTPRTHLIATVINWFIWLAFCGEFLVRLAVAPHRPAFVREAWFDLLIIVITPPVVPESLQGVRAARALRLLRLIRAVAFLTIGLRSGRRALGQRQFHLVLLVAVGVMLLSALGLYVVERQQNEAITSFADAVWWAVTTTTTVGYGDIYPRTLEGRLIAVLLMLTGIGVIGVFTASIASFFVAGEGTDTMSDVQQRLDAIERKLDALLANREQRR
jgi:voltage-gated potassium channel